MQPQSSKSPRSMNQPPITREQVRQDADPAFLIGDYAWQIYIDEDAAGVAKLPVGMQRLVAIYDLNGLIQNGGVKEYLANRTNRDDRVDALVPVSIAALRVFGAHEAADIVQ